MLALTKEDTGKLLENNRAEKHFKYIGKFIRNINVGSKNQKFMKKDLDKQLAQVFENDYHGKLN